jgi:hypothetical protein
MSKAFTREDDSGHEAELPERAISPHPNLVTAEGLAQIEGAIVRATEEQARARVAADAAAEARAARELRYWSARRATAQLTEPKQFSQCNSDQEYVSRERMDRLAPTASWEPTRVIPRGEPCPTPRPLRRP